MNDETTTTQTPQPATPPMPKLAWNGYQRYGATTEFKNFQGNPMPDFQDLPETIRRAWVNATELPLVDINLRIQQLDSYDRQAVSDGYHTFDELYIHRHALFATVARLQKELPVWRSEKHEDGTMFLGYFIAGIGDKAGLMMTYHLPLDWWDKFSFAETRSHAPAWDGHTAKDTIQRILNLNF